MSIYDAKLGHIVEMIKKDGQVTHEELAGLKAQILDDHKISHIEASYIYELHNLRYKLEKDPVYL